MTVPGRRRQSVTAESDERSDLSQERLCELWDRGLTDMMRYTYTTLYRVAFWDNKVQLKLN